MAGKLKPRHKTGKRSPYRGHVPAPVPTKPIVTPHVETRSIPRLSFRASVAPDTFDEKKRTVEVIWTTGARVMRGFFDRFWEELSLDPEHVRMERLENGAPFLDSHGRSWTGPSLDDVVGVVESARLEQERGVATIRFARDEHGEAVFAKVKDGILRHVSVGYQVHRFEQVEGGDEEIPVYRAVDWEPYEISLVPMGADAGAGVRSENGVQQTTPCEFVTRERQEITTMAKKRKPGNGTPSAAPAASVRADEAEQKEPVEGDEDATETETEDTDDGDAGDDDEETKGEGERAAAIREGAELERKRQAGIARHARAFGIDDPKVVAKLQADGTSLVKARAILLRKAEERQGPDVGGGHVLAVRGGDERDKYREQAIHALLLRTGKADTVVAAAKKRGENIKIDGGVLRGMSLLRLAAHCLGRMGVDTRNMSDIGVAEAAFTARAGGYQTTSDFPVIMDEVVGRVLLADYELAPHVWRLLVKIGSVSNFKESSRLRLGSMGTLDRVPEHAEFKNKPLPDGSVEKVRIATYGNIFAITRQVIIDDDLGAVMSMLGQLARMAGNTIDARFWERLGENSGAGPTMEDGLPLFHVDHGNIQPTGTALGVAGLDANRLTLAEQTDASGNRIVMRPHTLLVSTAQGMLAKHLNTSEFDIDAADGVTPNGVRGMFEQIVDSPEITSPRRYVFADPQANPTFEVNFLNGQQAPFIESRDGWRIDGKEYKVRHDFGVDAVDWRTALTDDGTP